MSLLRRKPSPALVGLQEAQAAIERAEASIQATQDRSHEVNEITGALAERKTRNHFGESLARAMEKRP